MQRAVSPEAAGPDIETMRKQKRVLKAASRTCMAARDSLKHEDKPLSEVLAALDGAVAATNKWLKGSYDSKDRAIRSRVYTYRAITHARLDDLNNALEDLKEGLFLNPRDAVALKFQARLQEAVATGYALPAAAGAPHPGKHTSPSRYVPTAATQSELLGSMGFPTRPLMKIDRQNLDITQASVGTDLDEFVGTIEKVHRDRPYPLWDHQKTSMFAERPPPEPEPERAPSRWDYVLHRVEDLFVDDEDKWETRDLLLAHIETMMDVFDYYCKVGSSTTAEGATQFASIKPNAINYSGLTAVAKEQYSAMFRKEKIDAPVSYLMALRQFWQLARDCNFVDDHCDLADINRIVVLSGRENTDDTGYFISTIEAVAEYNHRGRDPVTPASPTPKGSPPPSVPAGVAEEVAVVAAKLARHNSRELHEYGPDGKMLTSTMSVNDDENPHHPNNRFHAYEYRLRTRYVPPKRLQFAPALGWVDDILVVCSWE